MPQQVMIIEPKDQLQFKGPYTDVSESQLKLKNPTDKQMAFKVKTTAPRQYCVRPNSGFISAKEERVITVMLQPLPSGQPNAETSRHKFLVQTCYVGDNLDIAAPIDDIWKNISPDELMDSKLRVVFDQTTSTTSVGAEPYLSAPRASASSSEKTVEADLRRAQDHIDKLNAEVATLKKLNREYSSAASSSFNGGAAANEELKFVMWQVGVVALIGLLLGLLLAKMF